jgi:iron only hydrogenase large subunit-like protein
LLSSDSQKLLSLLTSGRKLTAMVAPSFPVNFKKNELIAALRKLGFDKICDHSVAIAAVNLEYQSLFKKDQCAPIIAANCPSTVALIKTRFPNLVKFLPNIPSPMVMNARLCCRWWPENLNVFIGPCLAKKQEAKTCPEVELVLTYKELKEIFAEKGIGLGKETLDFGAINFDGPAERGVKIFPSSGGMKATLKMDASSCRKIVVAEETLNLIKIFEELDKNPTDCVFYDVLACPGGCIGGPGILSTESTGARRQKLLDFIKEEGEEPMCSEADLKE